MRRGVIGKAPSFPLYASDFDMDTATWNNWEVGAYFRLLCYEWINGCIPDNLEEIARIIRDPLPDISTRFNAKAQRIRSEFTEKSRRILTKFTSNGTPGKLINSRMEQVREEKAQFLESQREKGIKSAKKRWGYSVTPVITTVTDRLQPDGNLSFSSSSSTEKINSKEGVNTPFKIPGKEEINEGSTLMVMEQIEKVCIQLYEEKIFPEVHAFKNKMIKSKKNPRSVLHTLCRAYMKREFEEGPWAYCQKIIGIETGVYSARDYGKTKPSGN